ncbi:hypothetical protein [Halomonas sp. PA16-9]|uniref:hypothetical protein n=1 Tax=Halomonas sp. PA16-9 TaxID=2576841 RepID=UPI0030EE1C01
MKHHGKLGQFGRHSFSLLARLGRYELAMLLCVAVLSGGIWGFIALADEVIEGDTRSIDESLLLALRNPADLSDPIGPGWVEEMGRTLPHWAVSACWYSSHWAPWATCYLPDTTARLSLPQLRCPAAYYSAL